MAPKRKATAEASKAEVKQAKTDLNVGDEMPDIGALDSEDGGLGSVDLKALSREKGLVIFFYPKANTGGCTTQACGFRDNYEAIKSAGYEVFGMSGDKPKPQASWKAKHTFPYHLLCDPSFEAMKKLGVTKGPKSIRRSHIIIAKGGKVAAVEYNVAPKDSFKLAAEYVAANPSALEAGTEENGGKEDKAKEDGAKAGAEEEADQLEGPKEEGDAEEGGAKEEGLAVKATLTVDDNSDTVALHIETVP